MPHRSKQGSAMSAKQLARTVISGQKIRVTTSVGSTVEGYLGGMDDYHWLIVTDAVEVLLVHKSAPVIHINTGVESYEKNENHAAIEKIIRPFRDSIQEEGLVPLRSSSSISD